MGEGYLVGADVGSSGCKAVLADLGGNRLATAEAGYPTEMPHLGWAEQAPADWYLAVCSCLRACVAEAGVPAEHILALSVTGPAHNAVLLDGGGGLLRPVIHWSDLRSTPQAEWLEHEHGERIFDITGQPVHPSWTLAQLMWVRENEPGVWGKLARILLQKDYIVYRLTGAWQTDRYDAIGTQLCDGIRGAWSPEIGALLGLDLSVLPPIEDPCRVAGRLSADAAHDTGLSPGTPVAVGSGDSVVEALGVGVLQPGECIVKLATSGAVNVVTAGPQPHRQTMTYPHLAQGRWYTICATNSGAASLMWFGRAFGVNGPEGGSAAVESLAQQAPAGCEGLIFHPYLQGERAPHWDPHLRGDFIGITPRHRQAHFARAVLEGVAYSLRDCLELLVRLGFFVGEIHLLGGGARSPLWRQITADVIGRPLRVASGEATALGAALLAGVAVEAYPGLEQAAQVCSKPEQLEPSASTAGLYETLFAIYQRAARDLAPLYHSLAEAAAG